MKPLSIILLFILSFSASAEWQAETIKGLQTLIYLPKINANKKALMVNLHGCAQKAEDLKKDGNWEITADEYNMIVAAPKVPNGGVYSGCWDYYGADHTRMNRHNAPVIEMVKDLLSRKDLNIDPGQVYVSGLSSGGGESMILGCMAPDIFAGMGLNAAPSTGTSANEIGRPKTALDKMLITCKNLAGSNDSHFKTQMTSIIYGNNDFIVNPLHDTNNAQIMSSIYNATIKKTFDTKKLEGSATDGTGTLFEDNDGPRISLIMNTNLGHNWPAGQGGNAGNFISKKSINYPAYITKFFFQNNRRSKSVLMPDLLVSPINAEDSRFSVSGSLNIPIKEAREIEVTVKENSRHATVDRFIAVIDSDGYFSGTSKNLKSGLYEFSVKLTKQSGMSRMFNRSSWMGEVPGIMTPQLINVSFESVNDCLNLKGQAVNNGGDKLRGVHVLLDKKEIGLTNVEDTTFWYFSKCGISNGVHALGVYAENESNYKSTIQNFKFITDPASATATLQEHMEAHRLEWTSFGEWYKKFGHKSFTLYLWPDKIWRDTKAPIN